MAMNFQYTYIKNTFILSEEEHKAVLTSVKEGNTQIILRGGKLGFNLSAPFLFEETIELTIPQKEERDERMRRLALKEPDYTPPTPEDIIRRKAILAGKMKIQ